MHYLWGPGVDMLLASDEGDVNAWAMTDQQNTVQGVLNKYEYSSTTTLYSLTGYNAFGNIPTDNELYRADPTGQRFTEKIFDYDTGLQYNNVAGHGRWYASSLGVWMTRDDLFPYSGSNANEYVRNSPTNWIDPTGLQNWQRPPSGYPGEPAKGPVPPAIPPDPYTPPGPGWKWKGPKYDPTGQKPGGAWDDGHQSLKPHLNHPGDKRPHWDWVDPNGNQWEYYPETGKWNGKPTNKPNRPFPQFPPGTFETACGVASGAALGGIIYLIIEYGWPVLVL